jgi:hypothetical protein
MSRFVLILLIFVSFITPQTIFSDQKDQIIRDTIEIRELGLTTDYILIKPLNHNEKKNILFSFSFMVLGLLPSICLK